MADPYTHDSNPYAAPEAPIIPVDPWADDPLAPQIASIGWRFVAFMVDYTLLCILIYTLQVVMMIVSGYGLPEPFGAASPPRLFGEGPIVIFSVLAWVVYSATLESSSRQATLGKQLFRLRVVRPEGVRISFGRAFARALLKLLGYAACFMGLILALFTHRRQALHDLILDTVVLRGAPGNPAAVD